MKSWNVAEWVYNWWLKRYHPDTKFMIMTCNIKKCIKTTNDSTFSRDSPAYTQSKTYGEQIE